MNSFLSPRPSDFFLSLQELYSRVEQLRQKYGLSLPVDPFELAARLHIEVLFHSFDSQKLAGILMKNYGSGKAVIILNENRSHTSLTFTLAHELMHYFLHSDKESFACNPTLSEQRTIQPLEWQANEGAAQLLVPRENFLQEISRKRTLLRLNPQQAVSQLAQKYKVSRQVILYRLKDLSYAPESSAFLSSQLDHPNDRQHSIDVLADEI